MSIRPRGQWDDLLGQGLGALGAFSYWHAKELRRQINGGSFASNAGGLRLSDRKLRQMCPSLYFTTGATGFARCLFGGGLGRREFIRDMLLHGDGRAAIVLSSSPLRIACYCDDSDAVCVLGFQDREVGPVALREGDRLLTVLNSYTGQGNDVAADLVRGDRANPDYINFWPLIAELLSDDVSEIERRKTAISSAEYARCRSMGEEHLRRLPGAVRDGRPDRSLYPAC
ncbi:hypothetical protein [Anatilimnocola floriformis]|uniref:hypothetical protein n=1 Tax=Anatilimnocola floriformis TaxID=2948575 RepID=UPI0020C4DD30|nr:hypothetical protein [Anatilimnocola floriformis]